jgi:hypothetical protein
MDSPDKGKTNRLTFRRSISSDYPQGNDFLVTVVDGFIDSSKGVGKAETGTVDKEGKRRYNYLNTYER